MKTMVNTSSSRSSSLNMIRSWYVLPKLKKILKTLNLKVQGFFLFYKWPINITESMFVFETNCIGSSPILATKGRLVEWIITPVLKIGGLGNRIRQFESDIFLKFWRYPMDRGTASWKRLDRWNPGVQVGFLLPPPIGSVPNDGKGVTLLTW